MDKLDLNEELKRVLKKLAALATAVPIPDPAPYRVVLAQITESRASQGRS